jgi:hypothetical protein
MKKCKTSFEAKASSVPENQVFRLDDDGSGKPRYFYIPPMEDYARRNLPISLLKADCDRAKNMLDAGVVNAEYVIELTGRDALGPILLCVGAGKDGGDLIVDGNHRYVAWTLALHERGGEMVVPAFVLEQEEWADFVVPEEFIPQMGLLEPTFIKTAP